MDDHCYIFNGPSQLRDLEAADLTGTCLIFNGPVDFKDLPDLNIRGATIVINQPNRHSPVHSDADSPANDRGDFRPSISVDSYRPSYCSTPRPCHQSRKPATTPISSSPLPSAGHRNSVLHGHCGDEDQNAIHPDRLKMLGVEHKRTTSNDPTGAAERLKADLKAIVKINEVKNPTRLVRDNTPAMRSRTISRFTRAFISQTPEEQVQHARERHMAAQRYETAQRNLKTELELYGHNFQATIEEVQRSEEMLGLSLIHTTEGNPRLSCAPAHKTSREDLVKRGEPVVVVSDEVISKIKAEYDDQGQVLRNDAPYNVDIDKSAEMS